MNAKELFQRASVLMMLRVLGMGASFLLSFYIARKFGAEVSGNYYLFLASLLGLSLVTRFGIDNTIVRFGAGYFGREELPYVRGLWVLAIAIVCTLGAMLTLFLWWVQLYGLPLFGYFEVPYAFELLLFGLIPYSLVFVNSSLLRAIHKQRWSTLLEVVLLPVVTILLLWLFLGEEGDAPLQGYVYASAMVCFLSVILVISALPRAVTIKYPPAKEVLSVAYPLFGVAFLTYLSGWSATYILAYFVDQAAVGVYNVAWRIVVLANIILLAFNNLTSPMFADLYQKGRIEDLEELAQRTAMIMSALGIPLLIAVSFYADWVLGLMGEEFSAGVSTLRVLCIGQMISVFCGSVGYLLMMTGHEKDVRSITLVTVIFQILLGLVTIPIWGMLGAAVTMAGALIVKNIVSSVTVYRRLGIVVVPSRSTTW